MIARLRTLLSGTPEALARTLGDRSWVPFCLATIALGGGLYGVTLGLWRSPAQAAFTAIKFPLLVFLTCGANAALNGMLAQVLGLDLSFRQTTQTILMSFALAAAILCGLSPVMLFLLWNTPAIDAHQPVAHSVMLASHVAVIALAGVVANVRLLRLLVRLSGSARSGRVILFSWLAGNLLLGSQLAWVLRPFVGSPTLAVEFLRADPLRGNFFEALWRALRHL